MNKDCEQLIDEILKDYHEKMYETVPFAELGSFMTKFLLKYKELHPYKKPSVTEIDGVKFFDAGDWEGL
ncbi:MULTISPECIES: hypothetical protein [Streptococcus]|uniref:hypothetical protein n=1 Tax=Streptococcus TaxID=1301 RepID=UPI0006502AB9|nr:MULTISPECIES: hypothetical protein [Streptococcus]QBX24016.1 hypothetical protein Javan172_0013 [Streptococcus phage Javan172]VGZ82429.1 Uncharacterised protein [Streptococcus pyogenes]VTS95124.1 metallophosphoesterase [Streptococcus dysgalactiae subsp. equisimilis]VTT03403.1 metallophosphoesterase [Streptococcus dysgalactiae subsp. equisimilis]GET81396.1 hypothetical protein KNZ15_00950 [Streptococcus dysgalactiae subsp. equisimilis]